jgi:hypothetical protein
MDIEAIIKFVIVLVIVIVPAVSQILAKIRDAKAPPVNPKQMPRGKPAAPPPPNQSFKDEIEEFLRRAAAQRREDAKPIQQARPASSRPKAPPKPPPVPKPVAAAQVRPVGSAVDSAIDEFGRRTSQLGEQVALSDDKLDAHLQGAFQHKLGQLDARSVPPATLSEQQTEGPTVTMPLLPAAAAGVAAALANPDSFRQAIVLTEILKRPDDRW